jgi:hypothetical protein
MIRILRSLSLLAAFCLAAHVEMAAAGGPPVNINGQSRGNVTIGAGQKVGPVTVQNSSISGKLTNNGTVSGGTLPGVAISKSTVNNVTNNGTITSNSTGIAVTGSQVSGIVNTGTISVKGNTSTAGIKIGP